MRKKNRALDATWNFWAVLYHPDYSHCGVPIYLYVFNVLHGIKDVKAPSKRGGLYQSGKLCLHF